MAKWVYETYCLPGDRVWDPCAGYGGRLVGALAAGVLYVGTDVDPETVAGNKRLAEVLGFADRADVVLSPAEVFDPGPVDLVFTSPPYVDLERYSRREEQSWRKHGTGLNGWVDGFLRPVIKTAAWRLPVGGKLVFNVADVRRRNGKVVRLVDATVAAAVGEGFVLDERLWMPISRLNRSAEEAREPLLVFRR